MDFLDRISRDKIAAGSAGFVLMFFALLGNLMDLAFAPFVGIAYLLTGAKMLPGVKLPRGEAMLYPKTCFLWLTWVF